MYFIGDPVVGSYVQLDEMQYVVLGKLDGKKTIPEMCRELSLEYDLEVEVEELEQFIDNLQAQNLLDLSTDLRLDEKDGAEIAQRVLRRLSVDGVVYSLRSESKDRRGRSARKRKERRVRHAEASLMDGAVLNMRKGNIRQAAAYLREVLRIQPGNERARYLQHAIASQHLTKASNFESIWFWRIRIVNPDRLLGWLAPTLGRLVFNRAFGLLWLAFVFASVVAMAGNAGSFLDDMRLFANPWYVLTHPLLLVAFYAIERSSVAVHEMMHGLACRTFGGRVREMGLLGRFLAIGAYCDISSTYLLENKWKRAMVSFAGPAWDLTTWCVAVWVYHAFDSTTYIGGVAYYCIAVFIFNVFLNLHPFYKNDGYLALTDLINHANLREEAFEYLALRVRRGLFGETVEIPEELEERSRVLLWYALPSLAITWLLIASTMYFITRNFIRYFYGIGLVLAVAFVVYTLWGPASMLARVIWANRDALMRARRFRLALRTLVIAAIAFLAVPLPFKLQAPCAYAPHVEKVRAAEAGTVETVAVLEGERVEAGQTVLSLKDTDALRDVAAAQAELERAQLALLSLLEGARKEELDIERAQIFAANAEVRSAAERVRSLEPLASRGLVPRAEMDAARAALANAETRQNLAHRGLDAKSAQADDQQLAIARADVTAAEAALARARAKLAAMRIVAPTAGVVVWRGGGRATEQSGRAVKAGEELFVVRDDARAALDLRVALSDPLGFIGPETRVTARLHGRSDELLEGRLEEISRVVENEVKLLTREEEEREAAVRALSNLQETRLPGEGSFVRARVPVTIANAESVPLGLEGVAEIELPYLPLVAQTWIRVSRLVAIDKEKVMQMLR